MRERTLKARIKKFQDSAVANIKSRKGEQPKEAWWLSFADEGGFRGALIIHAEDFTTAVMESTIRGLNPHGEVQGNEHSG